MKPEIEIDFHGRIKKQSFCSMCSLFYRISIALLKSWCWRYVGVQVSGVVCGGPSQNKRFRCGKIS